MRSLVKKRFMIPGGGVAETELSVKLTEWAKTQEGMKGYCVRAFAEALEVCVLMHFGKNRCSCSTRV